MKDWMMLSLGQGLPSSHLYVVQVGFDGGTFMMRNECVDDSGDAAGQARGSVHGDGGRL